jgi:MFS family permease
VPIVVPADYLLFHLGYFGLLPVLAALVRDQLGGGTGAAAAVGTVLFAFNAAIGAACLVLAPLVSRLSYRTGMTAGLVCSATGMWLLPYAHSTVGLVAAVLLAGTGMSVHGLLARSLVAEVIQDQAGRNRVFSIIQVAVNVSAAVGPMVATALFASSGARTLLNLVALCYLTAAVLVVTSVRGVRPRTGSAVRWPVSRATVRAVRSDPLAVRTILVSAAGGFLYAQFFSAIALLVLRSVPAGPRQGSLFLVNAIAVVALQAPVSALVGRGLRRGVAPLSVMLLGVVVFSVALLSLGAMLWAGVAAYAALFIAIVVFSLAETMYTPIVNTAYAGLPASSQIEAFNLRQIFVTVGESVGALSGAAIFLAVAGTGSGEPYWLLLAAVGLAVAAAAGIGTGPAHTTTTGERDGDERHSDDGDAGVEPGLAQRAGPGAAAAQRDRAGGA